MTCRSCGEATEPVLDLGSHRLPDFTEPGAPPPPSFPLELVLCPGCGLLQLAGTTPRELLYHDRYGFKSGVNEAIRDDLAAVVKDALAVVPHPARWLDIACNDGTLLAAVPDVVFRAGIDPLTQFAAQASLHADLLVEDYFHPGYFRPGEFDVITSVSMFYDLDDPNDFVRGVRSVLGTHGVWVIQQNYAADMIANNAVDNVCHEHVTYFAVKPLVTLLARHGLEVNQVTYSGVNGGCFRAVVSHRGRRPVEESVYAALREEFAHGLHLPQTWRQWGETVRRELDKTWAFLDTAAAEGKKVCLYGASTRGGTFLQMIGAGPHVLARAVERSPAKWGKVMAATGIPIISEAEMRAAPPDYLLVSPWFFRDVFVYRERDYLAAGGAMVFPLPRFEVVRG